MTKRLNKLINALRNNSRSSLTEMSIETDIPITTIFKMLKNLEGSGIITKHISLMDFAKLGYPLKIGIFLRADKKDKLTAFLDKQPNLNTLLKTSGNYNFYAEMLFKDMLEYHNLIETLENSGLTKGSEAHYFIADIKQEAFRIGGKN
jgi:Lrp/AsnC family leucine-responsive transcriptional regulator